MADTQYRLEMRGVVKTFPGVKALDHAQLRLKPGTVHALMGENDHGKRLTRLREADFHTELESALTKK